ncbi:MAG: hypothetical protein EHM51_00755 [Geobacter sp.]|nr:MAG: hypothetical protein EHM51_00755 [Geobacter sp.]
MSEEQKKMRRLCTEIQLFDLCDKDRCNHKDGRYCTSEEALAKFEAVLDEEDRATERFLADRLDEGEEAEDLAYDEDYAEDEYSEEEDRELDEEEDF